MYSGTTIKNYNPNRWNGKGSLPYRAYLTGKKSVYLKDLDRLFKEFQVVTDIIEARKQQKYFLADQKTDLYKAIGNIKREIDKAKHEQLLWGCTTIPLS